MAASLPANPQLARLASQLEAYRPFNEQEACDRQMMLERLAADSHCLERCALAHFTCSLWTVNPQVTQTLMVYHNIYDSWSWIGGHADGEDDLAAVALRELEEETGVADARLVPCGVFSVETMTVDGHEKRGRYVGSHLHMNLTYLAVADSAQRLCVAPDENSGVQWVDLEQVVPLSSEPWIRERIYRKLIAKLSTIDAADWQAAGASPERSAY